MDRNLEILIKARDEATKVISKVQTELDWISKSATTFNWKMKALQPTFQKMAWYWTLIAGTIWWTAIKAFATFEKQMSKVKAITWATWKEFEDMNKLAKKMWAETAFTAKEAWDAFEFLWMAWLTANESMTALPWTLELAAAGSLELWEAADIATNIMAQFWIEAKDIWRVNDVLAKSATSANTSVQEMAEAMKYVWPVSSALKVPLEETAAAINVLANNGIKWGLAGQSFSASLLRISKPTTAMSKSMDAMNLTLFDAQGKFIWLTNTVKQLELWTKNLTDEQKAEHISTVFWIQSTKQWLTLLKDWSWEIDKYTESLENSTWAAKKMADAQLDNLAGSFTLLTSAINWVQVSMWETLNEYIRPMVQALTAWISENKGLAEIIWFVTLALAWLIAVAWTIWLILPALVAGFWVLTAAAWALWTALMFLAANPIWLIITAIWMLIYMWYEIWKNWDTVKENLLLAWEAIKNWVMEAVTAITTFISESWEWLKQITTETFSYIWNFISNTWDKTKAKTTSTWNSIKSITASVWGAMKSWASSIFASIKDDTIWKFQAIMDFALKAVDIVKWAWSAVTSAVAKIKSAASSVWSAVWSVFWAKATWWQVDSWRTYLVGERWPELFTAPNTWRIIPNNQMSGWATINVNISWNNIDSRMDLEEIAETITSKLTRDISIAWNFWIA